MSNALIESKKLLAVVAMLAVSLTSGCAINMAVAITDPPQAVAKYQVASPLAASSLFFSDERTSNEQNALLTGVIPMRLTHNGKPFNAAPWVAEQTVKELAARGLPVTLAADANSAGHNIKITRLHIESSRVSGFSPFITFTTVRADLLTASGQQRITAYVKRGKVPIWSFDEIIDPTFNDPLMLVTKELAAKINQRLFGQMTSDQQVAALVVKIDADRGDPYLDVYELGFGNNKAAVPHLVRYTHHAAEYVRLAAISSLGILRATEQLDLLKNLAQTAKSWQDRGMALKAIGDLGTPEALAFLKLQSAAIEASTDREALWNKDVLALYL